MTIQIWQDRALGDRFAVEVTVDGTPVQAMQLNGKRDEEYAVQNAKFNEDYVLSEILSDPHRYTPTARTLRA